jgi:hypothetical protein
MDFAASRTATLTRSSPQPRNRAQRERSSPRPARPGRPPCIRELPQAQSHLPCAPSAGERPGGAGYLPTWFVVSCAELNCRSEALPMEGPRWRSAATADLASINEIANQIHWTLPERDEVFAEKFNLFPQGCFVYVQTRTIVGYGLAHPWMLHDIPKLDTFVGALPSKPDCLFIHDVAILPKSRGHGGAEAFVKLALPLSRSRKLDWLALVSVYGTGTLWSRFGFKVTSYPQLREKLRAYGEDAQYMTASAH